MQVTKRPSPNFNARVGCDGPSLIVLHYTAMEAAEAALQRLCDPVHEVSAHYLIDRNGKVFQLVSDGDRAWHAGQGSWGGLGDVNSRSVGVELDNDGTCPFADPLMRALEALLDHLMTAHEIRPESVIGHQDMAPDRKCDPGAFFDWQRLAETGRSVWPRRAGLSHPNARAFFEDLSRFGYPTPAEVPQADLLTAFRNRFRGGASGPLDSQDMAMAADLAARFPIDRPGART